MFYHLCFAGCTGFRLLEQFWGANCKPYSTFIRINFVQGLFAVENMSDIYIDCPFWMLFHGFKSCFHHLCQLNNKLNNTGKKDLIRKFVLDQVINLCISSPIHQVENCYKNLILYSVKPLSLTQFQIQSLISQILLIGQWRLFASNT